MRTEQKMKIGMSLALATVLSLGITGCGGNDDTATPVAASTAVDITVERGKVYDANVTDSSIPAQVATQKSRQNVYTFANAPVYPVVVNGGWIDVNDDGVMDKDDVKLDIEMKSYSTTVTPITTVIADANETIREQKLAKLVAELNVQGIGADKNVTAEDLLKVPSEAPRDVMVMANAVFKDMKENNITTVDTNGALDMGQFNSLYTSTGTAVDVEKSVISQLGNKVEKVSSQDVFEFKQKQADAVVPTLATALLLNNITDLSFLDWYTFNADYTLTDGIHTNKWSVSGETLTIIAPDGDIFDFVFTNETPVDGDSYSYTQSYIDENGVKQEIQGAVSGTISITEPVTPPAVVTPPTTGEEPTLPDLGSSHLINIYKNMAQIVSNSVLASYSDSDADVFNSSSTSASCTDFGFTSSDYYEETTDEDGRTLKSYTIVNGATATYPTKSCTEHDYSGVAYFSGTENVIVYY